LVSGDIYIYIYIHRLQSFARTRVEIPSLCCVKCNSPTHLKIPPETIIIPAGLGHHGDQTGLKL